LHVLQKTKYINTQRAKQKTKLR